MKIVIDIPGWIGKIICTILSCAIAMIFTVGLIFTYKILVEDFGPCEGNAFMTIIKEVQ